MNRTEKDDYRVLKREKLKNFLSERRSQKATQTTAKKEAARRLAAERRARLISERTYARQRKESLKEARVKARVKTHTPEISKNAAPSVRPESGKRVISGGEKTKPVSGGEEAIPSFSAAAVNQQAENRQKFLSYLGENRARKAEVTAEKTRQKKAAAAEKLVRRADQKREKQLLRQQKLTGQSQQKTAVTKKEKSGKAAEISLAAVGYPYRRQQLLAYLKSRKAGGKTFAVQRRELKKVIGESAPELIPIVVPLVMPPAPGETAEAVTEKALPPVVPPVEEKPAGRRRLLPARGKKIPSEATELAAVPKATVSARKPFRIIPFLKDYYIRIIFVLLILGWFLEIAFLNRRLEVVNKQVEQVSGIAKPHISGPAVSAAKISPLALETTRVEGIRDPFSDKLWRIQEITPTEARGTRPVVRAPGAPSIIKAPPRILITKRPEFTPPEVAKAIPESEKLTRIPPVTVPQVGSVLPSTPVSNIHFRGILNVAGIDYFFVEGAGGGYRVRVGDTVEGFKIYDYRNGVLYFAKDGYAYQLNEERVSPPLRYRGRMIMSGQEYFFLEGQRTYRAVIGESIEGYQLLKRVGDYLYFVREDRLYYLKQE